MGPGKIRYTREFMEDDSPDRFARKDRVEEYRQRVSYTRCLYNWVNNNTTLRFVKCRKFACKNQFDYNIHTNS